MRFVPRAVVVEPVVLAVRVRPGPERHEQRRVADVPDDVVEERLRLKLPWPQSWPTTKTIHITNPVQTA